MGLLELLQQGRTILSANNFVEETSITDLLQQGQTGLSAGSFPNDTPINDPQSGFIQDNSPTHTYYGDETVGQPNNGSDLINTFGNTALDITNINSTTDTANPTYDWVTNYPSLVKGKFNAAPSLYNLTYNSSTTYLNNVPIQTPDSPQLPTLSSSSLDNTGSNAPTTIVPDSVSYPNNYPTITNVYLGEFRGAPSPYETIYNPDNTYLVDVPIQTPNSPQIPTLYQSSLDNINNGNVSTTNPVPNANNFPNNYPILSPQTGMGSFGLQPNQYYTIWASNNKYYSQNNYNNIITNSNNPLIDYMDLTGLTLDPNSFASFIQTSPFNQTYLGSPGFPPFVTGQFNGAPSIFQGTYDGGNIYLNNVPIKTPNSPQLNTLDETGLDNTNLNANLTSFTPNGLTAPNNYPTIGNVNLGEFNGAPSQYQSLYNADATYLSYHPIQQESSPQSNTLNRTGLDNTSPENEFTAIIPSDTTSFPSIEGANLGEWNGAPTQYNSNQAYRPDNTYLSNVNIGDPNSPQIPTLEKSGLDNTGSNLPTTIVPDSLTYPNTYPAVEGVNLGIFNGAPSQYQTTYTSTNTYLDSVPIDSDNSRQKSTVLDGETALDNTVPMYFPTTIPPNSTTSPTIYPSIQHANLGEFNGAPSQYQTTYTPNSTYLDQYSTIVNEANPQIDSLQRTGMDIQDGDEGGYEATAIFPPNPDTITVYPAENVTSNSTGGAPHRFEQLWRPAKRYYNDYIKSLKEQSLV